MLLSVCSMSWDAESLQYRRLCGLSRCHVLPATCVRANFCICVHDACSTQQWTKLHYTRPYHLSSSIHCTRVFVLTTHLRCEPATVIRLDAGFLCFLHTKHSSLSVFTVKVNRVGYFLPLSYPLFVGRNPSRILLTPCIQNNTRNSEWCTGVQDSH